jgi:hypothetical protein
VGGKPGNFAGSFWAGTGGGSGGNVVFQGLSVSVIGQVFANGGGGGAGWLQGSTQFGQAGADATRSTTVSAPGGVSFSGEGAGGAVGRLGASPGPGLHASNPNALPGGGGGSVGFFQSYAPVGASIELTPSSASPGFASHITISTR